MNFKRVLAVPNKSKIICVDEHVVTLFSAVLDSVASMSSHAKQDNGLSASEMKIFAQIVARSITCSEMKAMH